MNDYKKAMNRVKPTQKPYPIGKNDDKIRSNWR